MENRFYSLWDSEKTYFFGSGFCFAKVEVLLHKTLDKTGLLQRHFIPNSRKKTVIAEKNNL